MPEAKQSRPIRYRWGHSVGILLLIAAFPFFWLTTVVISNSLALSGGLFLLVVITGIGVLRRKAFGWCLYFGWIALLILACAYGAVSHLVFHVVPEGYSFSGSMFIQWLSWMVLGSLFLYLQIRYWRRRATLSRGIR